MISRPCASTPRQAECGEGGTRCGGRRIVSFCALKLCVEWGFRGAHRRVTVRRGARSSRLEHLLGDDVEVATAVSTSGAC